MYATLSSQTVSICNGLKTPTAEPVTNCHGLKSILNSPDLQLGDKLSPT